MKATGMSHKKTSLGDTYPYKKNNSGVIFNPLLVFAICVVAIRHRNAFLIQPAYPVYQSFFDLFYQSMVE